LPKIEDKLESAIVIYTATVVVVEGAAAEQEAMAAPPR
jgi:hypothetical protein